MNRSQIAEAFVRLGGLMQVIPEHIQETAHVKNNWFTLENIRNAANGWSYALRAEAVQQWLNSYTLKPDDKKVGIIMAGNIPFVGLHDLLCAIASGHRIKVKLSSQDEVLMGHLIVLLKAELPFLEERLEITEKLNGIDYLIATGSNNSSRYFEYYFKDIPSIIRKNRTSVAILDGSESETELKGLADDIYTYFGLGCRNVTHLLLPKNFELKRLYEAYDKYIDIVHHHKYYNNYMYHKSILLMNLTRHYDNGFMLFQEKEEINAPIATLNYHFYENAEDVREYIESNSENIQCIVGHGESYIPFGKAQMPELWDYADGVDIMAFLNK